jgi:hypothetical protein
VKKRFKLKKLMRKRAHYRGVYNRLRAKGGDDSFIEHKYNKYMKYKDKVRGRRKNQETRKREKQLRTLKALPRKKRAQKAQIAHLTENIRKRRGIKKKRGRKPLPPGQRKVRKKRGEMTREELLEARRKASAYYYRRIAKLEQTNPQKLREEKEKAAAYLKNWRELNPGKAEEYKWRRKMKKRIRRASANVLKDKNVRPGGRRHERRMRRAYRRLKKDKPMLGGRKKLRRIKHPHKYPKRRSDSPEL